MLNPKNMISDRNGITFVVIHCDDVDAVLQRLPNHVCYIVEYLVRFVSRLKIDTDKQNTLMMRLVAALTHQSVVIKGTTFPDAKLQFSKLRGGTADSTLKFMLRYHQRSQDLICSNRIHQTLGARVRLKGCNFEKHFKIRA